MNISGPALPLVSIGVASFNNAPYIRETLASIVAQDYPNWELIIVDDCSSDNSVEVVRAWMVEHPNIPARLIEHSRNQGVCRVLNQIIEAAKGEFVSTIGSDDNYLPNKLRAQVQAFAQLDDSYGMVYSDIVKIDAAGLPLNGGQTLLADHATPEGNIFEHLLTENFIPAMGQLTRTAVYRALGGFDEKLLFEDWDMWLRVAKEYHVKYVPIVAAQYRIHDRSATFQRRAQMAEACAELLSKQLGVSASADAIIARQLAHYAESLYWLADTKAAYWLGKAWQQGRGRRTLALLTFARLGVAIAKLHHSYSRLRQFVGLRKPI